jgi:hypothetical protein
VVSDEVVEAVVVVPLCVCAELVVVVAGAVLVVELPFFFFAFVVDVVCAMAIDPAIRNALIQKLAANFKYVFIDVLSRTGFRQPLPVQYTHPIEPSRYNFRATVALKLRSSTCCDTTDIFQSASADLNFMQSG